jgi:hypothetical protein
MLCGEARLAEQADRFAFAHEFVQCWLFILTASTVPMHPRESRKPGGVFEHYGIQTTEIYIKSLVPETVRPNERPILAGVK